MLIKKTLENSNSDFVDGIHLLNSTSTSLPFQNESFDRVLALESAHHMKNFRNFVEESKRILKKDGILALTIPVVNKKTVPIVDLGILSMTWTSAHYSTDYIKSSLDDCDFSIVEMQKIGSLVYEPLVNYYIKNRKILKNRILSKYPSYIEKILFKSLLKMKQVSEANVIDYLLIKCKRKS